MRSRPESDAGSLFDGDGRRKYLCEAEWRAFLAAAAKRDAATRTFCAVLAHSGCRVSEALALTPERIDHTTGCVIFLTLKRRRRSFRAVPIPPELLAALRRLAQSLPGDAPLFPWTRQTAWRRIKTVMAKAGIKGAQATPKGLRHAFGIRNAERDVPAAVTRIWMGHSRLETLGIYQQAVEREERAFARRLWRH